MALAMMSPFVFWDYHGMCFSTPSRTSKAAASASATAQPSRLSKRKFFFETIASFELTFFS